MGKDVEFKEDMEPTSTRTLQRVLVKWIQGKTPIGLMATNGSHRIAKAVYHGESWLEIYETWYDGTQKRTNHLLKNPTSILEIPRDSIIYQGIIVTVHYPKRKCWIKEIIQDLKSYRASHVQQGILVGVRSCRDTVQSAMEALVDGKECGRWNWDHNHCLDTKKMYPTPWTIGIWQVYKTLCEGNPARAILIGEICKTDEATRKVVGKDKEITDKWVEEKLTATHLTKTASHAMQLKDPKVAFPHQMFPTVSYPYKVNSPPFNSTNLPNYLRIIMFGFLGQKSYNNFQHLAADVSPCKIQIDEKRQYLKLSNLFDNEFLVVQINETVIAMADTYA
jgi:hypothetical protein